MHWRRRRDRREHYIRVLHAHHGGKKATVRAAKHDDSCTVIVPALPREAADYGGVVCKDVVQREVRHDRAVVVLCHVIRPRRAEEPVLRSNDTAGIHLLRKLQQRGAGHGVGVGRILWPRIKQHGIAGVVGAEVVELVALVEGAG